MVLYCGVARFQVSYLLEEGRVVDVVLACFYPAFSEDHEGKRNGSCVLVIAENDLVIWW